MFSADAFLEFQRYVSGLIVSENKTVDGINRLFVVESRNQSSLNRLLTESPFSLEELNRARLRLLASLAGTQLKPKGVLGVDDTLLIHYGQDFEKIAKLFDPVTQTYVWAHDLVTLHDSDEETDYPVLFQLGEPVELEKLEAGMRAAGIPLKASQEQLAAVAHNRQPIFHRIRIPFKGKHATYYRYCNTHRLPNFGRQRLVINYRQAYLSDNPTFYLSNRLFWHAAGITRIRRHRWLVEVYHEEGKAEGLDQYQLRDFRGIQRQVALVAVVYSLLRAA